MLLALINESMMHIYLCKASRGTNGPENTHSAGSPKPNMIVLLKCDCYLSITVLLFPHECLYSGTCNFWKTGFLLADELDERIQQNKIK